MPTTAFSTLVPNILPYAPGCPTPTAITYIKEAAREACERTLAWRVQIGPTAIVPPGTSIYAGTQGISYVYDCPANTEVHAVLESSVNDVQLQPTTLEEAARLYPKWAEVTGNDAIDQQIAGEPRTICQISPTEYILLPMTRKPLFAGDIFYLRMFVALKPTVEANNMDSSMLNELKDLIVHNALQRLLTMPKQNWTDAEMAGYHAKQYLFKLSERRARANLGNMRGKVYARMQPFS